MALPLDTLEYARLLRKAGFSERQAEGQAQALAATMTASIFDWLSAVTATWPTPWPIEEFSM